jgi:hypothetical protein
MVKASKEVVMSYLKVIINSSPLICLRKCQWISPACPTQHDKTYSTLQHRYSSNTLFMILHWPSLSFILDTNFVAKLFTFWIYTAIINYL